MIYDEICVQIKDLQYHYSLHKLIHIMSFGCGWQGWWRRFWFLDILLMLLSIFYFRLGSSSFMRKVIWLGGILSYLKSWSFIGIMTGMILGLYWYFVLAHRGAYILHCRLIYQMDWNFPILPIYNVVFRFRHCWCMFNNSSVMILLNLVSSRWVGGIWCYIHFD